jgi:predicted DNA-binding transcriptional regulator AlpA
MPNEFKNDSDVLMTKREIAEYLRLSVSRIGYYITNGILPKPSYLSPRTPRWRKSEIDAMLDKLDAKNAPIAEQRRKLIRYSVLTRKSVKVENEIGDDL